MALAGSEVFLPSTNSKVALHCQIGLLFHCRRIADLLNGLFDEDEASCHGTCLVPTAIVPMLLSA